MIQKLITELLIATILALLICPTGYSAEVSSNMHVSATILPYDRITISPSAQVNQQTNDKVEPVIKRETVNQDGQSVTFITIYS